MFTERLIFYSGRKRSFLYTLIELLITISIILILISMLLPSLTSAKKLAKRITCLNQLKTLYYGTTLYAADNNGWYMDNREDYIRSWTKMGNENILYYLMSSSRPATDWNKFTAIQRALCYCPNRQDQNTLTLWIGRDMGYFYLGRCGKGPYTNYRSVDMGKVLFSDMTYNDSSHLDSCNHERGNPQGSNHVWNDGHARWVPKSQLIIYSWAGLSHLLLTIDKK